MVSRPAAGTSSRRGGGGQKINLPCCGTFLGALFLSPRQDNRGTRARL
nr:MAG TPA: hypothetical protein [Caudoviricetes sp.]